MEWVQKPSVWDFSRNLNKPLGGSSKRAKATVRTLNLSCLVDGCVSDLSNCRDYHRRHRVCEQHSKTPVVTVGGKERRFCQQCSRFQCLGEFDEEKRSCRKRLEGHNRRRRKLQPETFCLNSGSFLSLDRGKGLVLMSKPSVLPAWSEFAEKPDNSPDNGPKTTTSTALARVYNGCNGLILGSSPYSDDISHLTTSGQGLRTTLLSGILTESIETRRALSFLSSKQNLSPSGDFGNFSQHYSSQGEGGEKPRVPVPHPERDVHTLQRGTDLM